MTSATLLVLTPLSPVSNCLKLRDVILGTLCFFIFLKLEFLNVEKNRCLSLGHLATFRCIQFF